MLIFILLLAVAGAAGFFWFQQKEKSPVGKVFRADMSKDCTIKDASSTPKGTLEIQVKSSDKASVIASAPLSEAIGAMTNQNTENLQTTLFFRSGCVNYTTDGDKITFDFSKSDAAKWFGAPKDKIPNMVFTKIDEEKIRMTEADTGSTCVFTRVADQKTDSSCEKPSLGCRMM